nr:MAG TPA: hypothetical protein [Caudoviricetes sp.]
MTTTMKRLSRNDIKVLRENFDRRNAVFHGGISYPKPLPKSVIARRTQRQAEMRFKHRDEDVI